MCAVRLQWPDTLFDDGLLALRRQLIAPPLQLVPYLKGERDEECIDIDREVLDLLWAWKKQQTAERLAATPSLAEHAYAGEVQPNQFVFTCSNGHPIHPGTFPGWFRTVVDDAGLPWRKVHGTRHTHGYVLLNNGWSMEKVRSCLGHSTQAVTERYYGHIERSRKPTSEPLSFTAAIAKAVELGGSLVGATGSEALSRPETAGRNYSPPFWT